MKKGIILLTGILLLLSVVFAIDGAQGIGTDKSKIEVGYAGGGFGLAYNIGLSQDLTVYGSLTSGAGITGIGGGAKYAVLNEKRGHSFSLAPKVDLAIGGGTIFPIPGLVASKKYDKFTGLVDFWTFSPLSGVSFSWIGVGGLFDITKDVQFAAEIGSSSVRMDGFKATSGLGIALGINIKL